MLRLILSTDENSGTTRYQTEAPAMFYIELLLAKDDEPQQTAPTDSAVEIAPKKKSKKRRGKPRR
jgi:hypothetical protein